MAAPHISALAGLLYSYYTSFTHDQIRLTIFRYVDVLGSLSRLIGSGGRINAYRAITALLAPTGMTAAAASSSQIIVNWIDNATGEDGYKLERATASTGYTQIATPAASITSYTDNSVIDGTTYVYRARAYNSIGDGFYGNETSATTPLNKPTNLSGTTPSSTQVQLTWTDNSQSEDGIAIERSSSGPFAEIARVGSNVNSYTDSTVSPSTVYEYRIRAFNSAAGFSSYSNTILVTTPSGGGGGGGGGGGCSLSATHQDQAGVVDIMLVTMPLIVTVLLLRRRR
jgi:hypothetical protein